MDIFCREYTRQMALPNVTPMELVQQKPPFDHPDWLFEIKYDGFRSLAYIDDAAGSSPATSSTTNASKTWRHEYFQFAADRRLILGFRVSGEPS